MSDYDDDYSTNNSDSESDISDNDIKQKKDLNSIKSGKLETKHITIDDDIDEDDNNDFEDYNEIDDYEDNEYNEDENDDDEQDDDDNFDENKEIDYKQSGGVNKLPNKENKNKQVIIDSDDDDDEDDNDDEYLQKFNHEINKNYIDEFHPECLIHNYDEISKLTMVIRDKDGIIIDPFHRTIPFLTKYEKTRVLGQRAKQIENGAKPFINVPENIIDSYVIAELELKEKKIPFIIRRPLPSGSSEYWNLKDLEIVHF